MALSRPALVVASIISILLLPASSLPVLGDVSQGAMQALKLLAHNDFCWKETTTVFAFGNSFTNVIGKTGSVFTWDNFNSPDSVTNNPIQANASTAHGPNYIMYLTNCFEGLPQKCSPQLYDLAFGGATVNASLIQPSQEYVIDFVQQVENWEKYIKPSVTWEPFTTLTSIWFGINDIRQSLNQNDMSVTNLFKDVLTNYFNLVERLYGQGMRTFMFINVLPLERTPDGESNKELHSKRVSLFNRQLSSFAQEFSAKHLDVTVLFVDAHQYFSYILDHAAEYGIKNTTGYCADYSKPDIDTNYANYGCLPLNQYFWLNDLHPMYPVHQQLAKDISAQLNKASNC